MTSAQVIFNSLYGLFQISEASTQLMLEKVENIHIPVHWESVDLIKQTVGLMCTTSGLSLTEELLFVRKALAVVEFCMECKNVLKAFKLEFPKREGM